MNIFRPLNYQNPLTGEMLTVQIIAVRFLLKWLLLSADRVGQKQQQVLDDYPSLLI